MSLRVLVCGGRDFCRWQEVFNALDAFDATSGVAVVIQGGASGADKAALTWAQKRVRPSATYPADWRTHGKRAGPMRNAHMLAEGRPDIVLAFPGGSGTRDMVRRAKKAGMRVVQYA